MEVANFLAWFVVIVAIVGFGLGSMFWAYVGPGSKAILFDTPVEIPSSLPPANEQLANSFKEGYDAFQARKYSQAVDKFSQAIQIAPTFAQAYHNRGLAQANLRQDNKAVADLLRGADLYAQQGNQEGINALKHNLEALKARAKEARANT